MTMKSFSKSVLFLYLATCVSFLHVNLVHAQQLATLSVTVTDPAGGAVSGAQVTVSNTSTGLARMQTTDSSGLAILTALTAGDYEFSVKADAFSERRQSVTLTVGQAASISVKLGIAVVKQSVAVSGSSAITIDSGKTETSQVIRPN